jgi:hypothetical protein
MRLKNRKRFEAINNRKPIKIIPHYIVDNGHITYTSPSREMGGCILCGKENISHTTSPCEYKLNDIDLQIFMDSHEEVFELFLYCGYAGTDAEEYAKTGYAGFKYIADEDGKGFYIYQKDGKFMEGLKEEE